MAPTLALRFLSCVLFFFMNDHGIGASRDLKVELRDQKQVDSYGATPVSKAEPYITGSKTTPDSTQANYVASYTFMKQNHPSHHEKLNLPYITGYKTSTHEANEPYLTGYRTTGAHEANQPANYLTGYRTSTHDSNEPYTTGYKSSGAHEANQPTYITAYKTSTHDSNEPYITGYKTSGAHEANQPNYITAYRTSTHDSNEPYITGYKTSGAHEANQPYIAGNKPTAHDSSQHARDATEPYITKYGRIGPKKDQKKLSAQDHNKPYITQYGDHVPKQDYTYKKKSENAYAAKRGSMHFSTNRKSGQDLEESKGGASSNVDHTEAFKTGFFSLEDLYVGNTMTLQFPVQEISNFLPRKEADSIPFSMSQLPSVLQLFSISEDSPQAKSMRDTLEQCEAETITGETKICANSLESMLEFIGTIIGSETKYDILTTSHPTASGTPLQKYTILEVSQDIYAPKWVACHPLPYPYAIYYCHFIATGSKVFKVLLGGENGDKIEALGICHLDTSDWSPNHIIFRQLGFKPGEAPVCHFFPVKHLMWVPQPSKATM